MKALFYTEFGTPDVLTIGHLPDPILRPADVLLAVSATALNRLDIVQRNGWFTLPGFSLPHVAGMDLAGTVVEVGSGVSHVKTGDRVVADPSLHAVGGDSQFTGLGERYGDLGVIGATHAGGYGELCAVSADHVHPIPDAMDFATAAVFPTAWMTTHHALFRVGELRSGETLLVHGATSALTLAATQMAVAAGARVLVTAASEEKCAIAQGLGAAATTTNRESDVTSWAMQQTDGKGVDMVLDHVGPALWEASLFALAPRGRLVTCGNTTGDSADIPSLGFLFQRGVQIKGSDAYFSTDFARVWAHYCEGMERGRFSPQIQETFAVEDGAQAHRLLETGEVTGRLVMQHKS